MRDYVIDIEDQIQTDGKKVSDIVEKVEEDGYANIRFRGEDIVFEQREMKTRDGLKIMCKFGDEDKQKAMSELLRILFELFQNSIGNMFKIEIVDDSYQAKIITFGGEKN